MKLRKALSQLDRDDPRRHRGNELCDILQKKCQDYVKAHGRYVRRVAAVVEDRLNNSEAEQAAHQLEIAEIIEEHKNIGLRVKKVFDLMFANHAGAIDAGRSAVAAVNSSTAAEADEPVLQAVEAAKVTANEKAKAKKDANKKAKVRGKADAKGKAKAKRKPKANSKTPAAPPTGTQQIKPQGVQDSPPLPISDSSEARVPKTSPYTRQFEAQGVHASCPPPPPPTYTRQLETQRSETPPSPISMVPISI